MRIYDDGWYYIVGIKARRVCNVHYFFKDKPIHKLKYADCDIDYSTHYFIPEKDQRRCGRCLAILQAYSHIGLENRLI